MIAWQDYSFCMIKIVRSTSFIYKYHLKYWQYILCEINPGVLYKSLDKKQFSSVFNKRMLQKTEQNVTMINEKSTRCALSMYGVKKFSKRKQQEQRHQTRLIVYYREIAYLSEYYGRMGRV